MEDKYLLKYIWLCKNYIAPIDGILPVLIKKRDYGVYVELVDIFIYLFNKNNTENKKDEIIDSIFSVYSDKVIEGLKNELRNFHTTNLFEMAGNKADSEKQEKFQTFYTNDTNTQIDKINFSINEISDVEGFIKKKYMYDKLDETLFDEENELVKKLLNFVTKYQELDNKKCDNEKDKSEKDFSFFIVSTEFFHAMHHLALYIFRDKNIGKNLQKAETHLERANRDLDKLELFLENKLTLSSFKKRVMEIHNINKRF